MVKETVVFALTANKNLTEAVCKELNLPAGKIRVEHFADGEILVEPPGVFTWTLCIHYSEYL